MAQIARLGTGGGPGKKKKETSTNSFSLLKPVTPPSKMTSENIIDNVKNYNPKPMNTGQGPTREKSKKTSTPVKQTTTPIYSGGGGGVSSGGNTQSSLEAKQKEHEKTFREKYEKQIQNELDRYEKQLRDELDRNERGINDEISRLEASGRSAIDRNNEYLSNQIAQLQDQRVLADQDTINLMNRRGAFYSGGTDYFLAQNQRATQEATGNLQSEIGSRNAEIEQGNQMARERALSQITMSREQAMSTLTMMREQAPDKVRQLVDEALERQWAKDFQMEQFNFQKQQAAAAAARAAASQALSRQRFNAQQAQQAWENEMAEKQFNLQASNANTGQSTGLGQRDLEVFASQYGAGLDNASSSDVRTFVNNQYANGLLYDEGEADQLESYLNSMRSPGGSSSSGNSWAPAVPRNIGSQWNPLGW